MRGPRKDALASSGLLKSQSISSDTTVPCAPGQVFNVGHWVGSTQTGPWRLLLLAAAHFFGIAWPKASQRCNSEPKKLASWPSG
jgi:hypothetical protein